MDSGTRYVRDPHAYHGRVEMRPIESEALRGNSVGDPHVRELPVYLPPGTDEGADLPVVLMLAGFTGRGHALLETHPWREGVVTRYDRAVAAGEAPPAILVMPDAFTRYGGSQYVNSALLGRYEDYVALEIPAFIDKHYPTRAGRRALIGKSSGGFGAIHIGMRHPADFPVVASISGDCHFEYGYGAEFLVAIRALEAFGGDPAKFLEQFWAAPNLKGDTHALINLCAMSACYSPNTDSALGFDLPIDLHTGELIDRVWQRWLAFDPVVSCERFSKGLKQLEWLYLEAGRKDEFHLQLSLRILVRRLRELEIPHEHEEHDGGHFGLNERYLQLLPRVIERLSS